jgi:8-oxo-dGTP pyrophosphatase MutT (NUDIX family)
MQRHFTVSGFVVDSERTLLHWHRKNGMWLPPGGHIDSDEDPVQAVVREVREETGILCEVVPHVARLAFGVPAQITPPCAILVEDIAEGPHQHIDLVYFLRPASGVSTTPHDGFVWVSEQQLRNGDALPLADCGPEMPVPDEVRALGLAAMAFVEGRDRRCRG